ncbi:hypothetical protein HD806DRAFT_523763 [Xylariaceae sp. AK1471]|nr:hypothetical protein HD806DRAFT_523763 [Xylariaceae sp. AK1471]
MVPAQFANISKASIRHYRLGYYDYILSGQLQSIAGSLSGFKRVYLVYFLCYLDRSNIGNTKILGASTHNDLMTEAHITNSQLSIALFIFLVAYGLFEVLSNILLKKLRPSRWIRFLINMLTDIYFGEPFPGLVCIRVAFILTPATLANIFSGSIAYGISRINKAVISAFFVWFFLPSFPEDAKWLTIQERDLTMRRLRLEDSKGLHKAISLSLFTPSITVGLGYESLRAQLMTVPPYAVAYVLASWPVDHFNERGLHSAGKAFISAVAFLTSTVLPADVYLSGYGGLIIAASGAFACIPPTASVGMGIALNIGLSGAPGQIIGVFVCKSNEAIRGYPIGYWKNAALLLLVAVGGVLLRFYYAWRNKKILHDRVEGQEVRLFRN